MSDEAAASAPPPQPRKKKRKAKAAAPEVAAPPIGGAERAPFLDAFPSDPELDLLVVAFEEGNYALVRERAPRLADSTDREDVRRAAAELRRRIDPDPLTLYLLLAALALLAFFSVWYWTHKHV